jgi:hypothetical protein
MQVVLVILVPRATQAVEVLLAMLVVKEQLGPPVLQDTQVVRARQDTQAV